MRRFSQALVFAACLASPSAFADSLEDHPALKGLDLDGDNLVSKAEAAGYATVTLGFDRADRNRDGHLSRAEWEEYERVEARKDKARGARAAKREASASAGASAAKQRKNSAPPARP